MVPIFILMLAEPPEKGCIQEYPITFNASRSTQSQELMEVKPYHGEYRRITWLQWLFSYAWDSIFRSNFCIKLILPRIDENSPSKDTVEHNLSPASYDRHLHHESIRFSKLSFCKVKDIRKGLHYHNATRGIIDIPHEDVEAYVPFETRKYGMRGYALMHRIHDSAHRSAMKRRLVIAFHASRNKPSARATCMIGAHEWEFVHGHHDVNQPKSYVYLGWYATFAALLPNLREILTDMVDAARDPSFLDFDEDYSILESIDSILVTGPCMGGAIASLTSAYVYYWLHNDALRHVETFAYDAEDLQMYQKQLERIAKRIFTYTFGSPRVGDMRFTAYYNAILGNNTYRIVNEGDGKVRLPPRSMGFTHCGQEAFIPWRHAIDANNPTFSSVMEEPSFGAAAWLWRAFIPVRPHIYFSDMNIMRCDAETAV